MAAGDFPFSGRVGEPVADLELHPEGLLCSIPLYQRMKMYSIKRVTRTRTNTATTIRTSKRLTEVGARPGNGTKITPADRHRHEDARSPALYQTTPQLWRLRLPSGVWGTLVQPTRDTKGTVLHSSSSTSVMLRARASFLSTASVGSFACIRVLLAEVGRVGRARATRSHGPRAARASAGS